MTRLFHALASLALLFVATAARAEEAVLNPVGIKEWRVPWQDTRPRDPYVAPDGRVWFVGQRADYLAVLDPKTGGFERTDLDKGTGPHNVIVGDDGTVWYAGNLKSHIGRIRPGEAIHKIPMPDQAARDPHTLIFDGKGHIWFTIQGGNRIGRLDIAAEHVDIIEVPTEKARPYGIDIAPDGVVWVVLFGTNKLASVDPATLKLTEHGLPRADARPRRVGVTADGRVWYVDHDGGYLGALNPADGTIEEWPMPAGAGAMPYGMAIDGKGRVWTVETGVSPNRFIGFDPVAAKFFSNTVIPSGAGSVRHMDYDEKTGRIWFGTDAGTIGYAAVE